MSGTLTPATYWSRHAEAWDTLADAAAEYVGDPAQEEFFADLADAASYLTEHHFN